MDTDYNIFSKNFLLLFKAEEIHFKLQLQITTKTDTLPTTIFFQNYFFYEFTAEEILSKLQLKLDVYRLRIVY